MRIPHSAVQAVTIRGDLSRIDCVVTSGTGAEGDIVLARVTNPGGVSILIDWQQQHRPVGVGTLLLGVLANRDSTTHASGLVPPGGIRIEHGTRLSWLGGQSGLLGIETWTPEPGNPVGAQASATVEAIGLVTDGGRPVNITRFSRVPAVQASSAPVLVVCGTAAEVGKTTLACRLIRHLTETAGKTVVAIKPTGSGGITDSLAHKQAGALATYDAVDCGMPSSYTSAARFTRLAGRCLLYAEEHQPDLVVCELGGDVTWGNNDTFLRLPGLRHRIKGILCIAGDAAAALGARAYLDNVGLGDLPTTFIPAYTRNPRTFRERLCRLAPAERMLPDVSDDTLAVYLDAVIASGNILAKVRR
jgi:hypothetical protein